MENLLVRKIFYFIEKKDEKSNSKEIELKNLKRSGHIIPFKPDSVIRAELEEKNAREQEDEISEVKKEFLSEIKPKDSEELLSNFGLFKDYVLEDPAQEVFYEALLQSPLSANGINIPPAFKRVIKIAQALLQKPKILFLEDKALLFEEFGGLDFMEILLENFEDAFLIGISEMGSDLHQYDEVIMIEEGRVVKKYSIEEFRREFTKKGV